MHVDRDLNGILAPSGRWPGGTPALVVIASLVWVLVAYGQTTLSMIAIWARSETFAHGFIVLPIVLYLLWQRRVDIAAITPRPYRPALLTLVAAGAIWLVATRLSVNSVAQFAVIAMIPCVVWTVLGTEAVKTMMFPLAFLFFAVPFGEFLMPTLMEWTADVTVAALRASGIPVYREGQYFTIPSGSWSVVEACSGLRYLIASFMVGCLFAYLSFRSPLRRAVFVIASIAVPLVANWARAYMIVMLGHLSGNRIAVGADHLLYGWIFFGVVMVVLFWIGARWREDTQAPVVRRPVLPPAESANAQPRSLRRAIVAALSVTAIFPVIALFEAGDAGDANPGEPPAIVAANGWSPAAAKLTDWTPDISGAASWQVETFTKQGASAQLIVAYFGDAKNAKAITSTNQLVRTTNRQWAQVAGGRTELVVNGRTHDVRTAVVADNRERFAVWQWFWVDGRTTDSEFLGKVYQALALLRGHREVVAWVVVVVPIERGEQDADRILAAFVTDMGGAVDASLRRYGRVP